MSGHACNLLLGYDLTAYRFTQHNNYYNTYLGHVKSEQPNE